MKAKLLVMLAGIVLLAACKGRNNYASDDSLQKFRNDSAKIVKTADMQLKVKSVQRVAEQVSKLVDECGGTILHHNMQLNVVDKHDVILGNDSVKKLMVYNTTADIVIKIPALVIEPFMDSLNHLGIYVDERKMDIEDKTLDYLSEKLKAQNRRLAVITRSKIKPSEGGADSILALKDDIVDRAITNLKTNDEVKYSTLTLNLYQNNTVSAEVVPNDDISTYNSSLLTRTGQALSRGWFFFSEMIITILNFWAFILAVAIVWMGIKMYRKKSKITKPVA